MRSGPPRAVGELLLGALPQLEDRLLVQRMRRTWSTLVRADVAHRARPQARVTGRPSCIRANSPPPARPKRDGSGDTPRRPASRARDMAAEAYAHYTVAQLAAQGGRFKDALPPMEEALKRDPNSAFLWGQLAQWLVRTEQPAVALTA